MSEWWRIPTAFLVRAPLLIVGDSLEWVAGKIVSLGETVPGLPDNWRPRK